MKIEVSANIYGKFFLKESIAVKSNPYDFKIYYEEDSYNISISKKVVDYKSYMTKYQDCDGILVANEGEGIATISVFIASL